MMWGPAVARIAVDLALHGATVVTDVSFLGLDRFDAAGRSTPGGRPDSAAVPLCDRPLTCPPLAVHPVHRPPGPL